MEMRYSSQSSFKSTPKMIWLASASTLFVAMVLAASGVMAQDGSDGAKAADGRGQAERKITKSESVTLMVLGTAQDAGFPQAGCKKNCCAAAWTRNELRRNATSVALFDHASGKRWLFECTPDFPDQLRMMDLYSERLKLGGSHDSGSQDKARPVLDGIFLTHAHVGHYTGLIHLGREVMGTKNIPVHTMPRMNEFLKSNGPWSQLVKLKNIQLIPMANERVVKLTESISVRPIRVPHRDEFSETVGFVIEGPDRKVFFLPDIDKWNRWEKTIESAIADVDLALLDGTFYANGEIPGRDMALIPHPFVEESVKRFSALEASERAKVKFIHFNHTNPVLQESSVAQKQIERAGMGIAIQGEVFELSLPRE